MSDEEIPPQNSSDLSLNPSTEMSALENLKSIMSYDMKDGVVYRTQCRLCNSTFRKDAEDLFEQGRSIPQIRMALEAKGEKDLRDHHIRNHIKEHFQSLERRAALMEYLEDLGQAQKRRQSKIDLLQLSIDINTKELLRIIPIQTGGDLYKEKERTDMLNKALKSLREGIAQMHEMDSAEAQVKAMEMKFIQSFRAEIEGAKNDAERQMLISVLDRFRGLLAPPGSGA